jgi:hypothetical protein
MRGQPMRPGPAHSAIRSSGPGGPVGPGGPGLPIVPGGPGTNVIKLFYPYLADFRNKIECLPLASIAGLV